MRRGNWVGKEEFLSARGSAYARRAGGWGWKVFSPWEVVRWGVRTILGGSGDAEGRLKGGEFVMLENVERVAAEVLRRQEKNGQGLTDRIWSREAFAKELAEHTESGVPIPDHDIAILLRFLERDKPSLTYTDKVVKFKTPSSTTQPEPITHQDATIALLKQLISAMTYQCSTLSTRIASLNATAAAAVKSSNRISALAALRSKKLAERTLKQRADTLSQLEEVYTQIEQAADQVEIVRTMEASAVVLRGLNKQVGGVERVEDVIEGLREEMAKVDEVGQVIGEPLGGAREQIDEDEVDEELEAMEREERMKEERRVKDREDREAEVTRKRLEEIRRREDLDDSEKRRREKEVEQRGKQIRESITGIQDDAEKQLDVSTKRLSQMSIEDDSEAGRSRSKDRMEGVQEAVPENAS